MKFDSYAEPSLIFVKKIWDRSAYSAFTDLIFFKECWYCVFRESDAHVEGRDGKIRIIASKDADTWKSVALFSEKGVDLRDPKLSETPDGRLMLLMGGTIYEKKKDGKNRYVTRQPRVTFSVNGKDWSQFELILEPHEWLWRVTWHQGMAYGASYRHSDIHHLKRKWLITLFESDDGVHYRKITQWPITRYPNETTLRFLDTGEMLALVRREKRWTAGAWIGISKPPYKKWKWRESRLYFGGPNFLVLPDRSMIASGRMLLKSPYGFHEKTILAEMHLDSLVPIMVLPSGGDTSYPGMVFRKDRLWVSYYSSHDKKTAIYLAKIKLSSNVETKPL